MKKVLLFLISTILFLCSCNPNKDEAYDPHNTDSSTYQINRQDTINMAEDIITYLDNKDRDNIKALFAPQIAQEYDLDAQIDKIFEIYDGASISYEVETSGELQQYFSNVKSDGSYLIAESYVNKIANLATANKVAFPENLVSLYDDIANIDETIDSIMNSLFYDSSTIAALYKQRAELSRVPDALKSINENSGTAIVDEVAKQISLVDSSSLNYYEKIAILSSFTADISFNMFAAEVKAHSDFLVDWKSSLKDWIIIGGIFEDNWYLRAIIADMSIGEEYKSGLYDEYYDPDSNLVQEQITHHGEY